MTKIKIYEGKIYCHLNDLGWDIYRMYLAPLEQMPMGASLVRGSLYCVSRKIIECSSPPLISRGSSVVQIYILPHVSWLLIDLKRAEIGITNDCFDNA